jgi:phage tail sheath protein FI
MAASVAANVRVSAAPKGKWSLREVQAAMLEQCVKLRYRVAILDTPNSQQPSEIRNWLDGQAFDRDEARFGAVYYPWLKVPDELEVDGPNRLVPPSGHIAGAYAFTDINFGVQKPPANVELQFVNDLEIELSDGQQGPLNERGINAIRVFPGRGIRVWGARSASLESEWRFIHTRRLLSMIEDSVETSSRWTVYEPNDQNLRRMLTHALNIFLEGLWLSGGLKGARPEQGYFVKCDETNNPQSSIDAGFLVCQVGVAIAAPMEFITFELRRSVAGPQVVEA